MGSKGSKKGYAWLRSWLEEQVDEEGRLGEESVHILLAETDPESLIRWLPRLFGECREESRKGILRGLVPRIGPRAVPFLKEILAAPKSRLAERRLALEQLERLGGEEQDPASARELRNAEQFVACLPESLRSAEGPEGVSEETLRLFQGISPALQGVVFREILRRPMQNAFGFIERVLAERDDLWEEILEVLEQVPHDEVGRLLQLGHGLADKALRKKIRRVHHKRSARGLPVDPLEREEAGEAVWRPPVPPRPEGLLSLPDAAGGRMAWVIRPRAPKGMIVLGGWVDDQKGLMQFLLMDPSRKELDKYRDHLLTNPEFPVVECDAGFCASILEEAAHRGTPVDPEEAEAFQAARPLLKEMVPPERPRAPVYAVVPEERDGSGVGDPLGESATLLNEGLLAGWAIEAERIQPHLGSLEEISESRIIVHPMQKRERVDALLRDIAQAILSDPVYRTSWRRRLEDAAWIFYKRGLEGPSRRLVRICRYLEDPGNSAARISFFVELVRRGMEGQWKEKQAEERNRPSLIIKPT